MQTLDVVLQAIDTLGVVTLLVVVGLLVTRGVYLPKAAHQEVVAALGETIAELKREVARLESLVAGGGKGGDD